MPSLIDLRRRVRSVKNTQQITEGDENGRRVEAAPRPAAHHQALGPSLCRHSVS